jgi:D-methionine transport system ATP-binding protein
VWFDGQELQGLRRPALRAVRRRIGTIYQHFHLVKTANVWENVALPLRLHGLPRREVVPRVDRFLNLVGLSDKAKAYPAQLSGGQKQRVAIARALAGEPELLLSDEGTSALDPETKESILDLLRQIHRQLGITIVLITHELSVIQAVCHRVAIMDAGRIIESGSVEAVFSHPEQALTKSFLRQFWHDRLADDTVGQPAPGRRFVLSYSGESALRPALAEAAQRFGVRPNILSGVVTRLGDAPFGRLVIQIDEPADGALAFLRETGVQVEEVFHELG